MKITANELMKDLEEALSLLQVAGPNPLLIESDEYFDRFNKLTDKYIKQDDEDEE